MRHFGSSPVLRSELAVALSDPVSATPPSRTLEEVGRAEAMKLLGSVTLGRVVFTSAALPAIRPVNHIVDDGEIVIRTRRLASITTAWAADADGQIGHEPGLVVAYEADLLDPEVRLGWSVVVTGMAVPITDPERLARIDEELHPWVDTVMDSAFAIRPEIVTGYRFVAA
jgi:hypothetical protein